MGASSERANDLTEQAFRVVAERVTQTQYHNELELVLSCALDVARTVQRTTQDTDKGASPVDRAFAALPEHLRIVFVLLEVERLSVAAVARLAQIPAAKVVLRWRQARRAFHSVTCEGAVSTTLNAP